jgi:NADPH-dependent glutamate synthase beta subunit-like oxidoreductase
VSDLDQFTGDVGPTFGQPAHKDGTTASATTVLIVGAGPAGLFAAC